MGLYFKTKLSIAIIYAIIYPIICGNSILNIHIFYVHEVFLGAGSNVELFMRRTYNANEVKQRT